MAISDRKDEDVHIRYLRKEVPDVYGFVLQQIEGIQDEKAVKKLKEDYGDAFYDDLGNIQNHKSRLRIQVVRGLIEK